jgi:predicted CXXCH cytochrome family protein
VANGSECIFKLNAAKKLTLKQHEDFKMKTRYGFTKLTAAAAITLGFAGVASAQTITTLSGVTGTGSTIVTVGGAAIAHVNTSGVGVVTATAGVLLGKNQTQSAIPRAGETNIASSRHNLGTTGSAATPNHTVQLFDDTVVGSATVAAGVVVGTNQICVFCHTPHGFNTSMGEAGAPLWNKSIKATAYTTYNSTGNGGGTFTAGNRNAFATATIDGQILAVGSVSLACLSCHDGTQAMDNMINGPGSGNYSQNGANIGASQGYVFKEFATFGAGNVTGQNANGALGATIPGYMSLATGNPTAEGINLSTDLSNDHPIGIEYCGGGFTVAANSIHAVAVGAEALGTCGDRAFVKPQVGNINGQVAFWVDTNTIQDPDAAIFGEASAITRDSLTVLTPANGSVGATAAAQAAGGYSNVSDGVRSKSDLTLFNRTFAAGQGPSVECASCHDVHTANNGTFLRVSNYASGLCLSCHVK